MSVLAKILGTSSQAWISPSNDAIFSGGLTFGGYPGVAGVRVSPEIAMGYAAYFACIRNISEDVGKLPKMVFELLARGKEAKPEHPVRRLIDVAWSDETSAMAGWETFMCHALGWQGGFAEIVRDGAGRPIALHNLDPTHVKLIRDTTTKRLMYEVKDEAMVPTYLRPERVLHVHGLGYDGLTGFVMSEMQRDGLSTALAVQAHRGKFFANGAFPSGIIEIPGKMRPESLETLRHEFSSRNAGVGNHYIPLPLDGGMKWHQLTSDPEKSQLVETMKWDVPNVCRMFRMPPNKVGDYTATRWNSIESQNREYKDDTLVPWTVRIIQEIERKLFMPSEEALTVQMDFKALVQANSVERAQYHKEMFFLGSLSQNEIRDDEGFNPIEGGDTYYLPVNMQPMEKAMMGMSDMEKKPMPDMDDMDGKGMTEALMTAALMRCMRKEQKAVENAIKRFQKDEDRDKLESWLDDFYSKHYSYLIEEIEPIAQVFSSVAGADKSSLLAPVHDLVGAYIKNRPCLKSDQWTITDLKESIYGHWISAGMHCAA